MSDLAKPFLQGALFGSGIMAIIFMALMLCSAAHAETFVMHCYPAASTPYDVSFDTETRKGYVTGGVSRRVRTYRAKDVVNNSQKHIFYVAMTAPGQTRIMYLAFDYSGKGDDVSALKTKDGDRVARDKCAYAGPTTTAATPPPPQPFVAPQAAPQTTNTSTHMLVSPCNGVADYRQCAIIGLFGEITPGDWQEWQIRTDGIVKATVALSGPGGAERAALNIGRQIHLNAWDTFVPAGAACQSACAYIWAAGKSRTMGVGSEIAWHAAFVGQDDQHADGNGNALVGMYLGEIGYTYQAIDEMVGGDPRDWSGFDRDASGTITKLHCRMTGSRCVPTEVRQ